MAQLPPGRLVLLDDAALGKLRFPPPTGEVVVAVHEGALKAPQNRLTLAAWLDDAGQVGWVGAIDERMVVGQLGRTASPRPAIARRLFRGRRDWSLVWPGHLVRPGVPTPLYTLYDDDRPWLVVGELASGAPLAAPLNDARGNPKWYAPRIGREELEGAGAKDGQLEMAHLWSLPEGLPAVGGVAEAARPALRETVSAYYGR
ncbi:MAG: hypothetical protein ACLFRX_11460 [Gemmatimonadota bacterium]